MDKMKRHLVWWGAGILVAVAAIAWWMLRPAGIPEGFAASNGRIEATEVDIATKIAGRIDTILVSEGQFVRQGEVLAKMDTRVLQEQRLEAIAQIKEAEIILEGYIEPGEMAPEGPYGDHTGYYNEVDSFPVFTVTHITQREDAIYHSTYTGRPPDEPAVLGVALNEVFVPILQKQFPEIVDFYLPPEGCSYRLAVVTMKKQYAGHAKRVMMGVWSFLRQFMYTKFVIVCDDDVNARDWNDVIWAITTRMDPARDTVLVENTPIDYLDFASPVSGLGSKMGLDATNKWPGETQREWGRPIVKDPEVTARIDAIWDELAIFK